MPHPVLKYSSLLCLSAPDHPNFSRGKRFLDVFLSDTAESRVITYYYHNKEKNLEPISSDSALVSKDTPILDFVKTQLKKALEFHGLGGKTAVGYGFFYDFQDIA